MIAIYSTNRYEYDAIIFGGYQANITNVALYDTLGLVFHFVNQNAINNHYR